MYLFILFGYVLFAAPVLYPWLCGVVLTGQEYKPPGAKDIPIDLRVTLLPNSPNPAGYLRSKGQPLPPCTRSMPCHLLSFPSASFRLMWRSKR